MQRLNVSGYKSHITPSNLYHVYIDHKSCVQLLESEGSCDDPSAHSMTCAESFVAMFKTFSIHEDTTIVHYPDVVEDSFQVYVSTLHGSGYLLIH